MPGNEVVYMKYSIDAKGIHYKQLNSLIRTAAESGEKEIVVKNVRGQRYIGAGLTKNDLVLDLEGVTGEDLAFCLGGPTVIARNHAQNAVANTMNSGTVIVHGIGGDALAYGMRGGKLFIRDDAGYRVGIHMKEYKDHKPAVIVGGTTGDFLGEYMAGGTIIVLNRDNKIENVVGQADETLATGIHGGAIYIFNYDLPGYMPGIGSSQVQPSRSELECIRPLVKEYCTHFGFDYNNLWQREVVKLIPAGSRPFGKFYFPAYPVNTGLVPEQREMASPCEAACPVGIPTGKFLGHIRHGEYKEALDLIDSRTPFRYSNCGFICARLCVDACSRGKVDFPVRTSELARGFHGNHKVQKIDQCSGEIAVIGAGPAGLSSAYFLARYGYNVEVFEADERPGGKMAQVISRERLPLEELEKDLENISSLGIKFNLGQWVDRKLFEKLLEDFDHVIVAVGAHQPLVPPVKGKEHIMAGVEFLKAFNLGENLEIGSRAVLIGGGDAALDGIEALTRLGLKPNMITMITRQAPSAKGEELQKWLNSGVKLMYPYQLKEATSEGVTARDSSGIEEFIPGKPIAFIKEIPNLSFLPEELTLQLNTKGFFESSDDTGTTPHPRVSITGDSVGLGLVAHSISKGRECAQRIHANFQELSYIPEKKTPIDYFDLHLHSNKKSKDPEELTIRDEYQRCLHCGVCVRCDECLEACPREARTRDDNTFTVDLSKCGGCGSCAAACKGGVIRMMSRDQF